jgi:hypothetical protein
MAISRVNGNTATANNGGNPSVDMSTWGLLQDDLVIAVLDSGFTSDQDIVMNTSGYTEIADLFASDVRDTGLGVFYKKMGASPDSTAVGQGSTNASEGLALAVTAFRGVDTASPFDATATTATGANSANADPPSITFATSGVWVVIGTGCSSNTAATVLTFPAGYTTNALQTVGSDTWRAVVGMAYNSSPSSPENPGVVTADSSLVDDAWCAVTIALKPAAGGGAGGAFTGWGLPIF